MIVETFTFGFHLDLGKLALILLLFILFDTNLICHPPRVKAKRIIKKLSKINKQKIEVNSLLSINMSTSNINLAINRLTSIKLAMYSIKDELDENSKTILLKKLMDKQIVEISILISYLMMLLHQRCDCNDTTTSSEYDDTLYILKLYRPIYNRIYTPMTIYDILL